MADQDAAGINALIQAIAKAFGQSEAEIAAAFESNEIAVQFIVGEDGRRLIEVTLGERSARIGASA